MSIAGSHDELRAALEAAGVTVGITGLPVDPPMALIRPGDPWLAQATVAAGVRECRWSVILVAGRIDADSLPMLETLAGQASLALETLTGWTVPRAARAISLDLNGGTYLTAELAPISQLIEL